MGDADFAAVMVPVAKALWGEPSTETRKELRWGESGARSVNIEKGVWIDWTTTGSDGNADGGGVIDLVMRENGCDKPSAVKWLAEEGFIDDRKEERKERSAPPSEEPVDPGPDSRKKVVAQYDYTDRDGNFLYQVVRFQFGLPDGSWKLGKDGNPAKTFAQRRRGPDGKSIWNLDGIGHTIFRHPQVEIALSEGRTVFLPEGEKDVLTLQAWGLTASTNSGGAKNWTPALAEIFRGADVVIPADNDEPGRAGAEAKALSLKGIARRIRVLHFPDFVADFPHKGDVTDWRDRFGGTGEAFLAMVDRLPDWRPRPPESKFRAVRMHELGRKDLKHEYLVADMFERKGLAAIAGESQGGKSFVTVDLGGSIAAGLPFWGKAVLPGLVLYQAGEGEKGLGKRLTAWMQKNGIEDKETLPFVLLPRKVNLFVDDKDTDALIAEAKAWEAFYGVPTRLLVIDTWNKAARGANEISGQDVGKIIERMERISDELDCLVVFVHHLNAQGGKMRGHTSLLDDLNNVLLVKKTEISDQNGRAIRTMTLDKNKDGERGAAQRFILRKVLLEPDDDGKEVSTCVVDPPAGSEDGQCDGYRLTDQERLVYGALLTALSTLGEVTPYDLRLPSSVSTVVKTSYWRDQVRKVWPFKEVDSDTEEQRKERQDAELSAVMRRVGLNLFNAGVIGKDNDKRIVWKTGREVRGFMRKKVSDTPQLPDQVKKELSEMEVPF